MMVLWHTMLGAGAQHRDQTFGRRQAACMQDPSMDTAAISRVLYVCHSDWTVCSQATYATIPLPSYSSRLDLQMSHVCTTGPRSNDDHRSSLPSTSPRQHSQLCCLRYKFRCVQYHSLCAYQRENHSTQVVGRSRSRAAVRA
jgi:hypothetical protein